MWQNWDSNLNLTISMIQIELPFYSAHQPCPRRLLRKRDGSCGKVKDLEGRYRRCFHTKSCNREKTETTTGCVTHLLKILHWLSINLEVPNSLAKLRDSFMICHLPPLQCPFHCPTLANRLLSAFHRHSPLSEVPSA